MFDLPKYKNKAKNVNTNLSTHNIIITLHLYSNFSLN